MLSKIHFIHSDEWGGGAVDLLTAVTIHMNNGEIYCHQVAIPKGEPENPITEDEFIKKFKQCSGEAFKDDEIERLVDSILHLEELENMTDLLIRLIKTYT